MRWPGCKFALETMPENIGDLNREAVTVPHRHRQDQRSIHHICGEELAEPLILHRTKLPAHCGQICTQQEKVRASHWQIPVTTARRLPDGPRIIESNTQHPIHAVFFTEDGKQALSGGAEGMLRRWRVDDGHEIGEPIRAEGAEIYAAALSPDRRWLVCGLRLIDWSGGKANVRVWDAQTHEKVLDIHGHIKAVLSVDISRDSTKFATGAADGLAFIWSMTTGKRLVGPLQHDGRVVTVRFSPNGDHVATATAENPDAKSIRIYSSDNGQQLLDIPFSVNRMVSSLLTWSGDGRQLFAASYGEARCFDTSSGSLLCKWPINIERYAACVALARNQRFIVISANTVDMLITH